MEPRDYENLKFILSRTPSELFTWWESLDDEDKMYAVDIVRNFNRELLDDIKNIDKILDEDLPVQEIEPEYIDTAQAKEYLKKFQLQK
jgi:hypothetical protein